MNNYEFTVQINRPPTAAEYDALYENGLLDDSGVEESADGRAWIVVDRAAPTIDDAISSALNQIRSSGLTPTNIAHNDFVGRATIATRLGVTPQYVHLLTTGKRGPGGFPVVESSDGWAIYSWSQVADWARRNLGAVIPEDEDAKILAMADYLLRAKNLAGDNHQELIRALIAA